MKEHMFCWHSPISWQCPRSVRSERGTSTLWQKCRLNNSVPKTRNTNQQELPPEKYSVWWAQGLWRLWYIRWVILTASALGNLSKRVDAKTTEHRNKKSPANHQMVIPMLPWSTCHSEPLTEHQKTKHQRNQRLDPKHLRKFFRQSTSWGMWLKLMSVIQNYIVLSEGP